MTDILLFNQYFTSTQKDPDIITVSNRPINLLHLATYLNHKGMDCKIFELGIINEKDIIVQKSRVRCGLSDKKITEIIKQNKPKIIGIGCMYSRHYIDVIAIAKLIKKVDSLIQVVVGGNHATSFYDKVLMDKSIDFVVIGEGEITFHELCSEIGSKKNNFKAIKGIAFRGNNGEIIKTTDRELIANLDDLPMIDNSLVDTKKYAQQSYKSPFLMRYPSIAIMSSRGCPGKCIYCTVKSVWGRTWRGKSPERTVDEIESLQKEYGIKEFSFLDDSCSVNRKRWLAICDEIIRRNLNIRWTTPNGIAHWTLDKTILDKMKKAGCYRVTFGIESGNKETRKFLGKPYPLAQAKEMLEYANKIGMWTICTHILGFPYENKESIEDTIKFAKQGGADFVTFFMLLPLPTSEVYKYFKKEGLLNFDDIWELNNFDEKKYEEMNRIVNDGGAPTMHFTGEELKAIQLRAYRSFILYRAFTYLNPLKILCKIRSVEDFKYTVRLFCKGVKILFNTIKPSTSKTTEELLYD